MDIKTCFYNVHFNALLVYCKAGTEALNCLMLSLVSKLLYLIVSIGQNYLAVLTRLSQWTQSILLLLLPLSLLYYYMEKIAFQLWKIPVS